MEYNPFSLNGKTILITGASSGIGKATAIECSKMGASVIIIGRNTERLNETYLLLEGTQNISFSLDINNEEQIENMLDNISDVDGVVLAAGIVKNSPFQFIKKDKIQHIFNTNFFSPVLLIQQMLRKKKLLKGASIVFISSIDGPVIAHIGNSMYAASKGAISAIAKNMAVDLASKRIRVNTLLPGMTETPLIHGEDITQEQLDEDKKLYPLKRYGKPEEIAYAAIYFLSDVSSFTTGANLIVDGGFSLQ